MKPSVVGVAGLLIVASGLAFWLMSGGQESVAPAPRTREAITRVYGLGTVEARLRSVLGFEITGTLDDMAVDVGAMVGAGAILATLNTTQPQADLQRAEAIVRAMTAERDAAVASLNKAEAVARQTADVAERRLELYRAGHISEEAYDQARRDQEVAIADVSLAKSQVRATVAAMESSEADRRVMKHRLERHRLKAPYDALVVQRHMDPGTLAGIGMPVLTLVDPGTIWIKAYVDEGRAGDVRVGQPAQIRLRSRPDSAIEGRVVRLDVESDRVTEERIVYVSCTLCRTGPRLGEQAEVYIETTDADSRQKRVTEAAERYQ